MDAKTTIRLLDRGVPAELTAHLVGAKILPAKVFNRRMTEYLLRPWWYEVFRFFRSVPVL